MRRAIPALALAALAAGAGPASAQLSLESLSWQRAASDRSSSAWEDADAIVDAPPKLDGRLRASLRLKNRGPKATEAILLRYSITARISRDASVEGVWAIPFMVDERRVPKVGPNHVAEVPLSLSPALEIYLNRLSRAGWWPDRLKLQVMLEPHAGSAALQSLESLLEVKR